MDTLTLQPSGWTSVTNGKFFIILKPDFLGMEGTTADSLSYQKELIMVSIIILIIMFILIKKAI